MMTAINMGISNLNETIKNQGHNQSQLLSI
jgi:hypothetical protein